jgi:arginine decarboxylase
MDHSRAPVLDALKEFHVRGDVVFGPPAHKQGRGIDQRVLDVMGAGVFRSDVLLLNGLDDRRESQQILEQAQELMADAVGAEHAFFSTCGSSLSVKSAMLAVAGPGEKLLISRNSHKSVISGLIIAGIDPVWVHPHYDEQLCLAHAPEPEDVERALAANPDAKGMLLISPTDWGTCADIAGVAAVCHDHDVPLIVDEAWGAHLPFHPELPQWGMNVGADLVVTSVHKMGGAIEQSSVFHLQGDRVDPAVLKQREDLLGTTSSSSLVYASLDGWRRQMVERGHTLLEQARQRALRLREEISGLGPLVVLGEQMIGPGKAFEYDPLKIPVDVRGLGITGYQAAEWLRDECQVDTGAMDTRRIHFDITHADDDQTEQRLVDAVTRLVQCVDQIEPAPSVQLPSGGTLELPTVMRPRDAFFADVEQVPLSDATGRVAAEMVSPYPPGVPVIAPGELVTKEALDYLTSAHAAGALLPDPADSEFKSLRVVRATG